MLRALRTAPFVVLALAAGCGARSAPAPADALIVDPLAPAADLPFLPEVRDGADADSAQGRALAAGTLYLDPRALRAALTLGAAQPWLDRLLVAGEQGLRVPEGRLLLGVGDTVPTARLLAAFDLLVRFGGRMAGWHWRREIGHLQTGGDARAEEEDLRAFVSVPQAALEQALARLKLRAVTQGQGLTWAAFVLADADAEALAALVRRGVGPFTALGLHGSFFVGAHDRSGYWRVFRGPEAHGGPLAAPGAAALFQSFRQERSAAEQRQGGVLAAQTFAYALTLTEVPLRGSTAVRLATSWGRRPPGAASADRSAGAFPTGAGADADAPPFRVVVPPVPGLWALGRRLGEAALLETLLDWRDSPFSDLFAVSKTDQGQTTRNARRVLVEADETTLASVLLARRAGAAFVTADADQRLWQETQVWLVPPVAGGGWGRPSATGGGGGAPRAAGAAGTARWRELQTLFARYGSTPDEAALAAFSGDGG